MCRLIKLIGISMIINRDLSKVSYYYSALEHRKEKENAQFTIQVFTCWSAMVN